MKFIQEFKEFAMRGNVIDMAVGIIIGTAFGKIVDSLVRDVVMPPINVLTGGVDLADQVIVLTAAAENSQAITLNYGIFLNTVIDFVLIAFAVFFVVKQMNKLRRIAEGQPADTAPGDTQQQEPAQKECSFCYSSIPAQATRCPHCTSKLLGA